MILPCTPGFCRIATLSKHVDIKLLIKSVRNHHKNLVAIIPFTENPRQKLKMEIEAKNIELYLAILDNIRK